MALTRTPLFPNFRVLSIKQEKFYNTTNSPRLNILNYGPHCVERPEAGKSVQVKAVS